MGGVVWYQKWDDRQRILHATYWLRRRRCSVFVIRRTSDGVRGDASRIGYSCVSDLWVSLSCTIASIAVCRDSMSCKSSASDTMLKTVGAPLLIPRIRPFIGNHASKVLVQQSVHISAREAALIIYSPPGSGSVIVRPFRRRLCAGVLGHPAGWIITFPPPGLLGDPRTTRGIFLKIRARVSTDDVILVCGIFLEIYEPSHPGRQNLLLTPHLPSPA